ncbi:RDD family protein [Aquibacillus sp. LR5S19]|uniref:RDD family protein n=1 Tax=Aquibacillus rhizosphaerae TaxID=3051431 RepID=A0ABT7L4C4_9BACI|nr:RDD family protein [Aquibacillus sp. LR5S19]MDL4840703.1 RDD family protein [Aquibacillus sp. LR5S19]
MNQEQVNIKTPEYVSLQFQSAGLGSRSAAFIIDQLLLLITNILIVLTFIFVVDAPIAYVTGVSLPLAITIILIFVTRGGYFFILEYFFGGRTVGKRLLGIRVIQENGHSITLLSSFIRNLIRLIDSLPVAYFVGIVMIFFHSKHKRLGDLVAGTIVVHERSIKKKSKVTAIEKEIEKRNLSKNNLIINESSLKSFDMKDWKLLKTYSNRLMQLPVAERNQMTRKVAGILFPKLGIDYSKFNSHQLENSLLILYLTLKDEWEFEL